MRTAEELWQRLVDRLNYLKRYVARELFPFIQTITDRSPLEDRDAEGHEIAA